MAREELRAGSSGGRVYHYGRLQGGFTVAPGSSKSPGVVTRTGARVYPLRITGGNTGALVMSSSRAWWTAPAPRRQAILRVPSR